MTAFSILEIAKEQGGVLTTRDAEARGVSRTMLSSLVARGLLARSDRGVYTLPETIDDAFFNAGNRYRRGVFSHGSALYLHGLTDRMPDMLEMTFPRSSNISAPQRVGIRCHRVSDPLAQVGRTTMPTPGGHAVAVYSPERTICDVFKAARRAPSDEEIGALKRFLNDCHGRAADIFSMSRILKIDRAIRPYLEALS